MFAWMEENLNDKIYVGLHKIGSNVKLPLSFEPVKNPLYDIELSKIDIYFKTYFKGLEFDK